MGSNDTSARLAAPAASHTRQRSITLLTRLERVPAFTGAWLYLGDDYVDMLRWERSLPGCERISYAGALSDTLQRLRPELLRWVAQSGKAHGAALDWWTTAFAGKNLMATPLFRHICYLDLVSHVLRERGGAKLMIVCEDEYLLDAVRLLLRSQGDQPRRTIVWPLYFIRHVGVEVLRIVYRWLRFIGMSIAELAAARLMRSAARRAPADEAAAHVLIHTCIDDTCLRDDGTLADRYFGRLGAWLSAHGYRVTVMPWVYNTRRNAFELFRWFRASADSFLLPEDYLRVADYLKCALQVARSGRVFATVQRFGAYDVTPLIRREWRASASATMMIRFLLYVPALERWLAHGNACHFFIDMFENSPPERPQIAALRKFSPATVLIGYQHGATTLRDFLPYSIEPEEWERGLFPDRIVCSGELSASVLAADGFPPAHVRAGPALRYEALLERQETAVAARAPAGPARILVVLSLEMSAATELMHQLLPHREFFSERSLEIAVRAHPMTGRTLLLKNLSLETLPAGWVWAEGSLPGDLEHATLVIGGATNAQVDAAAFGVPVICIKRELGFDFNFLDCWRDEYSICGPVAAHELRRRISEILDDRSENTRAQSERLARQIKAGLGKLDDAHFRAFT